MSKSTLLCVILCVFLSFAETKKDKQTILARKSPTKMYSDVIISFGSFYSPEGIQEPDIFEKIEESEPDMFIWLGETLFSDSDHFDYDDELLNLKKSPGYQKLSKKSFITGVSDFGKSNERAKNSFFYFLGEDYHSERRQSNKLYEAFWIKTKPNPYHDGNPQHLVKVILLEVDKFEEDSEEITDEQFAWLSEELREEQEGHFLTVIASPYQILPHDKFYVDSLGIPNKLRLLKLMRRSSAPVILISGTLAYPFGEVLQYPCSKEEIGYDLYELTSSGLNSETILDLREFNRLTVPLTFNNFTNRAYKPNFGLLRIKYNHMKPSTSEIYMEIVNGHGKMLISKSVYIPEKTRYTEKETDMRFSCANKLYSRANTAFAVWKHLIRMVRDPEFRIYALSFFSIAIPLFLMILLCTARALGKKMGGGSRYFDEYEKYHME